MRDADPPQMSRGRDTRGGSSIPREERATSAADGEGGGVRGAGESTAALVAHARRGEEEAFAALVRRHLRAAYAVGLAILGSPADAEDVTQEAFLAAFERLDSCRDPERFSGWLLQIVRNRARNALERRRLREPADGRRVATAEGRLDPPDPGRIGRRERLLAALELLTPLEREVVLLHDLEGWTHAEIAEAVGTSEEMSRQHLFRARRVLRGLLPEDAPAGGMS